MSLNKNTVENIVIVLVAVIVFNTLPLLPWVGEQVTKFPSALLILAGVFAVFMNKILDWLTKTFKFLNRDATRAFLAILMSFFAFHSIPKFDAIKLFINEYALYLFVFALLLLANKNKIADIGGN